MPSSLGRRRPIITSWPETPSEQKVPDAFEATGDCVIERNVELVREKLPLMPRRRGIQDGDIPKTLGALAPGSLFKGRQNAAEESGGDRKQYPVEVEIKDVDMTESFLCGYLTIHDLTADYPNLTTFFEAEIIGPKVGFLTGKWDATMEADQRHWEKFPYFAENCQPYLYSPNQKPIYNVNDHCVVFMRWKEHFLVPDHHIESVSGASYAGFYYIAYDKRDRSCEGYYYHRESKDYQRLELCHVPSKVSPAFEFR